VVYAGFDEAGYNDKARIFNGIADGIDHVLDGCIASNNIKDCSRNDVNDHWIIKWNKEWERGTNENWSNGPYDAWQQRELNGMVPGGSQTTEHTKIIWVGITGADSPYWQEGGSLWKDQFEIVFLQGKDETGAHYREIKARPNK